MAVSKQVEFGYDGGESVLRLGTRGSALPITASCECDWLEVTVSETVVVIKAIPNYGLADREGLVYVSDRFGNSVAVGVLQHGYADLRVECMDEVAIPYTYYSEHDTYDLYITVYGGPTKSAKVKGLAKSVDEVWKLSDIYCDYMLRIPGDVSGTFTVTHGDLAEYREYCESHGIECDESRLKRKLKITQVTQEDMTGELKLSVISEGGSGGEFSGELVLSGTEPAYIHVAKCEYARVSDSMAAETVSEKDVHVDCQCDWLVCACSDGVVTVRATGRNPYANERRARIKLSSPSNPILFKVVDIVQGTTLPIG